ncbi:MAG: sigma-54-dependent Fis family transcriptional regulator, partial [Deltaproteobacteria bacterium]|nr:sigma-54-dependent Fis family transcriptional regulator [Deltaproteobacteria bacterium]
MTLRLSIPGSTGEEQELILPGPTIQIGRSPDNDVVLADSRISSHHARLVRRGEAYFFEDLASKNGSLVERQGVRTTAVAHLPLPLQDGDRLLLGDLVSPVVLLVAAAPAGGPAPGQDSGGTIVARCAIGEGRAALQRVDGATLRSLFSLLHDLSGHSEPGEVMARIAEAVLDRFSDLASITVLLRHTDGSLVAEHCRSHEGASAGGKALGTAAAGQAGTDPGCPPPRSIPAELLEQAVRQGELLIYLPEGSGGVVLGPTAAAVPAHAAAASSTVGAARGGTAWEALVPLTSGSEVIGAIHLRRGRAPFTPDDAAWLSIVGLHMAAALARARRFRSLLGTATELHRENASLRAAAALPRPIVGRSAALRASLEELRKVAPTTTTVLLLGETGTGKELAARFLHAWSNRSARAFLPINCAALPAQLLESELFGHRKGSFTGALRDHAGIFEAARGGTVLLDEIGEIPLDLQVKLLRVVQEREVRPLGANQPVAVDVRLVAATNRDLKAEVEAGRFRRDLYYRLSVFPVELPPLRIREADVALLAEHFRESFCARHGKWVPGFTVEALTELRRYPWPGNVRELEHVVERAVILAGDGQAIRAEDLAVVDAAEPGEQVALPAELAGELPRGRLKEVLEQLEEQVIRRCLAGCGDNRTVAAA